MLILILFLAIIPITGATASTTPAIVVNGETFLSPAGEPDPYINRDQRTMIPIRFFASELGVPNDEEHIVWDQETQTATITDGVNTVVIPLGSKEIKVNGETVVMDTIAEMKDHRVFIPARFLAEGLGASAYWYGPEQTAVFMTQEYIDENMPEVLYDLRDPYMAFPFFPTHPSWANLYGDPETLAGRIKEVRQIASKVNVITDQENHQFSVTIPEYDRTNYIIVLSVLDVTTQYTLPGTYNISFDDYAPNGAIFNLGIADLKAGSYILYTHYGYTKEGKYYHGEGHAIRKMLMG